MCSNMKGSMGSCGRNAGDGSGRQGGLDVGLEGVGCVRGGVALEHLPVATDQELGEVPLDGLGAEQARRLGAQPCPERVRAAAVDFDLAHHREADAVVLLAEGTDLRIAARVLRAELVAWETDHRQSAFAVGLPQILQTGELRREAAGARRVDDQQHAATLGRERDGRAIKGGCLEVEGAASRCVHGTSWVGGGGSGSRESKVATGFNCMEVFLF